MPIKKIEKGKQLETLYKTRISLQKKNPDKDIRWKHCNRQISSWKRIYPSLTKYKQVGSFERGKW